MPVLAPFKGEIASYLKLELSLYSIRKLINLRSMKTMQKIYIKKSETQQKIYSSRGMIFLNKICLHDFTYIVFSRNYHSLISGLNHMNNKELALAFIAPQNKKEHDAFFHAIVQEFHNFLASAITLVDHTRVFIKVNYNSHAFKSEYEDKKNELIQNNVVIFIKELRNATLHKGLPNITLTHRFENKSASQDLDYFASLDVKKLLDWYTFNQKSKDYLSKYKDHIRLDQLVNDYWSKISSFYEWFKERLFEIHEPDISELKLLLNKETIP